MFENLQKSYTPRQAKEAIDKTLKKYSEDCKITFLKTNAEISKSYLVTSVSDRHLICEIIARTGLTKRNFEDLSAEWEFHNVAYAAHIQRDHSRDVNLDYTGDPRRAVRMATKIFDVLDIE